MRDNSGAEKDSRPEVIPAAPWRVLAAEALPDFRLKVRFVDGVEGMVKMAALIFDESAVVFSALRDPAKLAQVSVVTGSVVWPGEIDLAPDAMYDEIKKHGVWQP